MPLVNSSALTPKKITANRANAQLSRGPITLEGLVRMRDTKIKHGAYARDRDKEEALRALGENAAAEDGMKDATKVGRLTRSCWRPAPPQPALLTPPEQKFSKNF